MTAKRPDKGPAGDRTESLGTTRPGTAAMPVSWRPLNRSEHFALDRAIFHDILRVTRISDEYPSTGVLREAHDWLLTQFREFDRAAWVLVWDGRRGKLRNDPEFEAAVRLVLPVVTRDWREFISINQTVAIKSQFTRWTRENVAAPIRAFQDEREAFAYAVKICAS